MEQKPHGVLAHLRLQQLNPFARTGESLNPFTMTTQQVDDDRIQDFIVDADAASVAQDPLQMRRGIWILLGAVAVFFLWAMLAQVDELTRGEGRVIPARQVQVIQSLDGGIVGEILVKEGDTVKEGQPLIKIDETRFISDLKGSRATYLALQAKAARLRAIAEGMPFDPPSELVKEEPALVEQERALYMNRKAELEAQIGIARQQLAQRSHELEEVRARREQASQSFELTSKELNLTRPLLQSGAVSDVDLLRLERDVSRFRGERDQASAQLTRIQSAISEALRKIEGVELDFRNQARTELADTQGKLKSLNEGNVALSDRVKQAVLKSPVHGTVKRLLVNTVGGVVQPGRDILEIVPLEDALLLEARVSPRDIAFLHPGQKAFVKFTAYDFSIYGGLEGALEHIGADSVIDEKGNAFYLVRVRTLKSSLGENLPIIPGMVAEVSILTGKKSILSYLLKPVLKAKQHALTER